MRVRILVFAALLASLAGIVGVPGWADGPRPAATPVDAKLAPVPDAEPPAAPPSAMVPDPIFDRIVSVGALTAAVENQDAALLTDVAVQLAAAEKKYARPHRSGLKVEHLFRSAVQVAAAQRDAAALDRLTVLLEARKDTAMLDRLRAIRATLKVSRAADGVSELIAKLPEEQRLEVALLVADLKRAKLFYDPEGLPGIEKRIADLKQVPPAVTNALKEQVKKSRAGITSPANETEHVLNKLGGVSRGGPTYKPSQYANTTRRTYTSMGRTYVYYTYVVFANDAPFTTASAKAGATAGKNYCVANNKSMPTSLAAHTFLDRSSGARWLVVGCYSPTTKYDRWIAGMQGNSFSLYAKTGGFLTGGYTPRDYANVAYLTSDDSRANSVRYSDPTWLRYRGQDPSSGARITLAIGADTDTHLDVYIVGPN
jgi:hypothetical protein